MFPTTLTTPCVPPLNCFMKDGILSQSAKVKSDNIDYVEGKMRDLTQYYHQLMLVYTLAGTNASNQRQRCEKDQNGDTSLRTNIAFKELDEFQRLWNNWNAGIVDEKFVPYHSSPKQSSITPQTSPTFGSTPDSFMDEKLTSTDTTSALHSMLSLNGPADYNIHQEMLHNSLSPTSFFIKHREINQLEVGTKDMKATNLSIDAQDKLSELKPNVATTTSHAQHPSNGSSQFPLDPCINLFQLNQLAQLLIGQSSTHHPLQQITWPMLQKSIQDFPTNDAPGQPIDLQCNSYQSKSDLMGYSRICAPSNKDSFEARPNHFRKIGLEAKTILNNTAGKINVEQIKSNGFSIPSLLGRSEDSRDRTRYSTNCSPKSSFTPERFNCNTCSRTYSTHTGLIRHQAHKHCNLHLSHKMTSLLTTPPELYKAVIKPRSTPPNIIENQSNKLIVNTVRAPQKLRSSVQIDKSHGSTSLTTENRIFDASGHCRSERPFCCHICTKIYYSMSALKMHVRTHTLPCKCTLCGKAFSRMWLLNGHLRTHTGEKPFACMVCARAFADRSNLRAHMQTHSEVKRYRCVRCAKTFSRMGLLTKHQASSCGLSNNGDSTIGKPSDTMSEDLMAASETSSSPITSPKGIT